MEGKEGWQWRGGAARDMIKKDACHANGCLAEPWTHLIDGDLEFTSGSDWQESMQS